MNTAKMGLDNSRCLQIMVNTEVFVKGGRCGVAVHPCLRFFPHATLAIRYKYDEAVV
jgi:hypothetical protein